MGRTSVEMRLIDRLLRRGTAAGMDDGLLLRRFLGDRDESAFAALVERHGPMVLGVCRRVLRDDRDVEDAFQATFLVLVRRAGTIREGGCVGPWLHGVAHRVATRARAISARRFVREGVVLEVDPSDDAPPGRQAERCELRSILDEELGRLPVRLRDPLILCHLEGLTHDQAAARLRQPVGTIRSRLSRGRDRLRDRLARRGVSAEDVAAPLPLFEPLSPALVEATIRSALAFASSSSAAAPALTAGATALAQGALDAMTTPTAKLAAVALGTILTLGGASGYALQQGTAPGSGESGATPRPSIPVLRQEFEKSRAMLRDLIAQRDRLNEQIEEGSRAQSWIASQLGKSESFPQETSKVSPKSEAVEKSGPTAVRPPDGQATKQAVPPAISDRVLAKNLSDHLAKLERDLDSKRWKAQLVNAEVAAMEADRGLIRERLRDIESKERKDVVMKDGRQDPQALLDPPPHEQPGEPPQGPTDATKQTPTTPGSPPGQGRGGRGRPGGFGATRNPGPIPYITGPGLVIAPSSSGRVLTGYSMKTGKATSLRIAPDDAGDVKVFPIVGPGLAALQVTGPKVERIAVFSAADGEWHPQDLREPAERAIPIVGPGLVAYPIGRRVYAFTAKANRWGILELPQEPAPADGATERPPTLLGMGRMGGPGFGDGMRGLNGWSGGLTGGYGPGMPSRVVVSVNGESAMCQDDHQLHVFSAETGTWTSIEIEKPELKDEPKAE